jgi:DNA-binding transcriptional MocR family regulator
MYSERMAGLKSSAIRDILKLTSRKGMISFAGGLPAPELFPLKEIEEAMHRALARYGSNALQYSVTEGISPLREKIAAMLDASGQRVKPYNLIITQGSQQGLELLSKLFLDKDSIVLTENPSYSARSRHSVCSRPGCAQSPPTKGEFGRRTCARSSRKSGRPSSTS